MTGFMVFITLLRSTNLRIHAALVLYEYIVTFSTEVQLFWGRKITGATVLFFLNRYMKLLDVLLDLELYSHFTGTTSVSTGTLSSSNYLLPSLQA